MATGIIRKNGLLVGGTVDTNSVANATVVRLRSMSLTKGVWLICSFGQYNGGIGSTTRASWYILNGGSTIAQVDNNGQYGGATSMTCLLDVDSTATVYFSAYQTSGSTQTVSNARFNAVRLS